ncbi:MAG: AAA family ATPase [Oscillospiraceae bacterium]|nr:AAA family ATPase [Oscillospiraceae bacterium]
MNIANNILKHSLKNVYFLVGTACSGKTTMANALSKKYGFIHFSRNKYENEKSYKVWQSIINEKYQPNSTKREDMDWEKYYSRSAEEFLADENDKNASDEYLDFAIIELIKLSQNNKVTADIRILDFNLVTDISDYNRIACLLAPGELIVRDNYARDDHRDRVERIQSLKDPEKKFETQYELMRIRAKEMAEQAHKHNLFTIMRTEESTVKDTLRLLEKHFDL